MTSSVTSPCALSDRLHDVGGSGRTGSLSASRATRHRPPAQVDHSLNTQDIEQLGASRKWTQGVCDGKELLGNKSVRHNKTVSLSHAMSDREPSHQLPPVPTPRASPRPLMHHAIECPPKVGCPGTLYLLDTLYRLLSTAYCIVASCLVQTDIFSWPGQSDIL